MIASTFSLPLHSPTTDPHLKFADTFAVFNRNGDIEVVGQGQLGLFHVETRHLSRMTIRLNGQNPLLLSSNIRDDNSFLSVDLTNLDQSPDSVVGIPRGTVPMFAPNSSTTIAVTNSCA